MSVRYNFEDKFVGGGGGGGISTTIRKILTNQPNLLQVNIYGQYIDDAENPESYRPDHLPREQTGPDNGHSDLA